MRPAEPPRPPDADEHADLVAALRAAGCVFAEDEARLIAEAAPDPGRRAALLARRVAGEPLEQLLGWAEFCGLRIAVARGVFVPRRRTELLVHRAATVARRGAQVVDLCCGSGAVAAALAALRPDLSLVAADVDPAAVACARTNLGPDVPVFVGDLFAPLPPALRGRVDVLAVNAPYVPTSELAFMPAEARDHEPSVALDGGADGLEVHRRVAAAARSWLAPGGWLLIEVAERQVAAAEQVFRAAGLQPDVVTDDELDATVVGGRLIAG